METTITQKQELIDWISSLEDTETLLILQGIKYQATFNFNEEFKKGIPLEVAKQRSLEKIREMWKKSS